MDIQELVRQHEPVLRFAKGENFFPMNVAGYIPHCSLHALEAERGVMRIPPPFVDLLALVDFPTEKHYLVYADRRVASPEEEAALRAWMERQQTVKGPDFRKLLQELGEKVQAIGIDFAKVFLPLEWPHEVFERALGNYGGIDKNSPSYYYRVTEESGYTAIQYWFFYAYNDFATSHGGVNDHEGDWECVHVFLKDGHPVWSTYSSHLGHGKELGRPWDAQYMEFEGEHPVVYVGIGSHASYHTPEAHSPDKAYVPGGVVVGGSDGRPWAAPEALDKPWFTEFKGRWGAYQWAKPGDLWVSQVGGAPTGPKFERDGSVRAKWGAPLKYAGLE